MIVAESPVDAHLAPAPVPYSERIGAMDIARGFALLGIFVMNIGAFSEPAGQYMVPVDPANATRAELIWGLITHGLFESKFYTLFSLLFGMGFIILTDRVQARNSSPTSVALRRFGFLAALGLMHAHLLWFGDILFIYAMCSLALLLCRRLSARILIAIGGALTFAGDSIILLMTLAGVIFGTGQPAAPTSDPAIPAPIVITEPDSEPAPVAPSAVEPPPTTEPATTPDAEPPADTASPADIEPSADPTPPLRGWAFIIDAFKTGKSGQSEEWAEAETIAYREGPWLDLAAFRSVTWGFIQIYILFGGIPRIIGLFILGAGLIRADFFSPTRHRIHVALIAAALFLAAPASLFASWNQMHGFPHEGGKLPPSFVLWQGVHQLTALMIPLAILSAAAILSTRASRAPGSLLSSCLKPLACTGRMALTTYLTQTLVGTTLCYFYGFALFGTLDPFEKILIVLGTFSCQLLISTLWFRAFAIGPAEWVWRSFTYLRPVRFR